MSTVGFDSDEDLISGVVVMMRNFRKVASPTCKGLIRFLLCDEDFTGGTMMVLEQLFDTDEDVREGKVVEDDNKFILSMLNSL